MFSVNYSGSFFQFHYWFCNLTLKVTLFYSIHKLIGHETFELHLDLMKISVSRVVAEPAMSLWKVDLIDAAGWNGRKLWSYSVHIGVLISQKKYHFTQLHTILRYFTRSYGNVTNQWWLFVCECLCTCSLELACARAIVRRTSVSTFFFSAQRTHERLQWITGYRH